MNTQVFFIMLVLLSFTLAYPLATGDTTMTDTQKQMLQRWVRKGNTICEGRKEDLKIGDEIDEDDEINAKIDEYCLGEMTEVKGRALFAVIKSKAVKAAE
jgi:hypothetical protein